MVRERVTEDHILNFYEISRIGKSIETGSRLVIAYGQGENRVQGNAIAKR